MHIKIGIIGGSGFYQMDGLTDIETIEIETSFGKPSDKLILGNLDGRPVAFLPRHGVGHPLLPSDINVRANIYALKSLGVEWLISVSAVGSLKQEIEPRHFVVPDQLYDHTKNRESTFFGDGIAAHISLAHPFCAHLSTLLYSAATEVGATVHNGGTYICMEGPAFSTQAESNVYRHLGFDIIGMTAAPEAKLAREAEICYAVLACSTDYDCWHPEHDNVTTEMILDNLRSNVEISKKTVRNLVSKISDEQRDCACSSALQFAIATQQDKIPIAKRHQLKLLLDKYLV
ncbi:MAG: S-methyl-5'-thioadenosine phosphorylase [Candidatus Poribacteria bacterium]|nr:S-methyl-5'-thioadenosine phosphorylase [Candidatus Poribacteria bacterium]